MPYTPPSHVSPASSAPPSPDASRRPSFNLSTAQSKPALPRSTSYLTKHRRSTSATSLTTISTSSHGSTPDITPIGTSDNLKNMAASHPFSIRQSPSPIANAQAMPPGAIISPPESSSEDEGVLELQNRGREIKNIKELQEAISAIPQRRSGSPNMDSHNHILLPLSPVDRHINTPPNPVMGTIGLGIGRTISHSRSHTDSHIYLPDVSFSTSEDNSEQDDSLRKPPMVRKKSGELVRPALRPASLRRPSSMPGTPTFTKAVHFDSHLEHVRHFLQVDRPLAVSSCSSPADNYDSDTENPFKFADKLGPRTTSHEWEIVMNNFPAETPIRKCLPVRLERVWMSPDQKSLLGSVSATNMAFQKSVVCRFTFDYWKTISEVGAEFQHEIHPRENGICHDRFQFSIKLSDIASLEAKTLYLCIRYSVNGLEYWDNNGSANFQIDFRAKRPAQTAKKAFFGNSPISSSALPRSGRRNTSATARPRFNTEVVSDEFRPKSISTNVDRPIHSFFDEQEPTGLRLKSSKSTTSIPTDSFLSRLSTPSGAAFANRYDFGASLTAAKQAQRSPNSSPQQDEGLYMKPHRRSGFNSSASATLFQPQNPFQVDSSAGRQPVGQSLPTASISSPGPASPSSTSIASASYEEILNKYCFFNGSKQSSPQPNDGILRSTRYDGVDEFPTQNSTSAYCLDGGSSMSSGGYGGSLQNNMARNSSFNFYNTQYNAQIPSMASPAAGSGRPVPEVSERSADLSDATVPTGAYIAAPSMTLNGSVPNRGPYHHIQRIQDRSRFTSDAHSTTVMSC